MPLDCEESVGHSCGCPFGLSSETGLLSTISFSGSDRMDNVLKDHRCPTQAGFAWIGFCCCLVTTPPKQRKEAWVGRPRLRVPQFGIRENARVSRAAAP